MEEPRYDFAKEEAKNLLKKYDVREPIVPVFSIARKEGLELKLITMPEKLSDLSGFFSKEEKTIFINNYDSSNRQMFTVAHELAHYILKHPVGRIGVLLRYSKLKTKNPFEQEANYFASCLLIPKKMLEERRKKYSLGENNLKELADIFGVSKQMIDYRLRSIKYEY